MSAALASHLWPIALCALRLLPVAFLCPILGGSAAPPAVRLSVVLALAGGLHVAGGLRCELSFGPALLGAAARELTFGLGLGLVASLPFDAARMGGRFIDLFRGSSAEAALPLSGTREAASADGLHQLLVALCATTGAMPLMLTAIARSFALVGLGAFSPLESWALEVVRLAAVAVATGLALGAPVAALSLGLDALLGLAGRLGSPLSLHELAGPLRILGGAVALWLSLGVLSERLLAWVAELSEALLIVGGHP